MGLVSVIVVMNLSVQTRTHKHLDTQGLGLSSGLGLRLQTEYQIRGGTVRQRKRPQRHLGTGMVTLTMIRHCPNCQHFLQFHFLLE